MFDVSILPQGRLMNNMQIKHHKDRLGIFINVTYNSIDAINIDNMHALIPSPLPLRPPCSHIPSDSKWKVNVLMGQFRECYVGMTQRYLVLCRNDIEIISFYIEILRALRRQDRNVIIRKRQLSTSSFTKMLDVINCYIFQNIALSNIFLIWKIPKMKFSPLSINS